MRRVHAPTLRRDPAFRAELRRLSAPRWFPPLPTAGDATSFVASTARNPEMRLAVLTDLRSRSSSWDSVWSFYGLAVAALAIVLSSLNSVTSVFLDAGMDAHPLVVFGWGMSVGVFGFVVVVALVLSMRSLVPQRVELWLRAYEDAIVHADRELSPDRSSAADHRRRTPFSWCLRRR